MVFQDKKGPCISTSLLWENPCRLQRNQRRRPVSIMQSKMSVGVSGWRDTVSRTPKKGP